ncbi:MAG: protein kinase [Polyangiaceae bacterium]|nr:protein kinase [Polyangiaceae bacterium]
MASKEVASFERGSPPSGGWSFGKYQCIAALGRGGMADVFLALARGPQGSNKLVVVKQLRADLGGDARLRSMFLDEARLAVRLSHPNVVQTYEVGETSQGYFMAMEYLEGQPLNRVALAAERAGRRVAPATWASVVAEVLNGLGYAHELCDYDGRPLGVVHRDVTPHNIFLTYDGQVKLVDFGIAKSSTNDAETEVGVVKGKASYMAPEQVRGERATPAADVFSAGVIVWELIAGRRLFFAGEVTQTMYRLLYEPVPPLSEVAPGVDPALERAVAGALVKDPSARLPSARALREALDRAIARAAGPSPERVRELLSELFAGEREAMRARVHAWMREADAPDGRPSWPLLVSTRQPPSSMPPANEGAPVSMPVSGALTPAHRSERPAPTARPRPGMALGPAFALAAAASVVGALAVAALGGRQGQGAAVPRIERAPGTSAAVVLRLHGSNTIGAELGPALAEGFWRRKGFAPSTLREGSADGGRTTITSSEGAIEVRATGSAEAFADLATGACDIGMASRRVKEGEGPDPQGPGGALVEHVLALEGIAVLVHPSNPLSALSLDRARDLFTGQLDDWARVPGAAGQAGPVVLYGRDERSGTLDTFRQLVLGGDDLGPTAQRLPTNQAVADAVAGNVGGLGFAGLSAAQGAKPVAIEGGSIPMLPSTFTVETEDYPLSRRLYLYAPAHPAAPLARDFVAFALSDEGQALVRSTGFVGLNVEAVAHAPCGRHCQARYRALTRDAKRLSLTFRFRNAGAELDGRAARDFDRLLAYLHGIDGPNVMLFGFSDDQGEPATNVALSRLRAQRIADELRARGVEPQVVEGFGRQLPVASNASEAGRARNRRVEVWLAPPPR